MQCAYILGLAARHITTTRPFVIVPAAANPGNDKHPAGKNKLLIEQVDLLSHSTDMYASGAGTGGY